MNLHDILWKLHVNAWQILVNPCRLLKRATLQLQQHEPLRCPCLVHAMPTSATARAAREARAAKDRADDPAPGDLEKDLGAT